MRHALALNENRTAMTPEYVFPHIDTIGNGRSLVQAWFAGAHIDMGGSAKHDGLSLYPLQWMLLESQAQGLVLEFSHGFTNRLGGDIDDPLRVVFPEHKFEGKGMEQSPFTTKNGIDVWMQDLRNVHDLKQYQDRYKAQINLRAHTLWKKKPRDIFTGDKLLRGFFPWSKQASWKPNTFRILSLMQLLREPLSIRQFISSSTRTSSFTWTRRHGHAENKLKFVGKTCSARTHTARCHTKHFGMGGIL